MSDTQATQKLPVSTKLLYGSGTVAFGVKDQGFGALLMLYYNQVVGLPASWVGAAIMIAMVVDAVVDPFIGQFSDDFRSGWGRRHPFMYAAAVPAALSYFFLWLPPAWSHEALFAYLVVTAIIVRISISLYEIPSTALLAEFSTDYDERTKLIAYRYFFGVVGGIGMNILAFKLFLQPTAAFPVGQLNPEGYAAYAVVAALIMLVSILLSSLGTHRRVAGMAVQERGERMTFWKLIRHMGSVLTHPAYVAVILFSLFSGMSAGLSTALNIYFSTYFWELSADQVATLTSSALIGIVLAFVVAIPVSTRFGKKMSALAFYIVALLAGTLPLVLRLFGLFPGNGDPALMSVLMVLLVITTMSTITASILAVSMVADVTDAIRLTTGKRSEGLLFSVVTMIAKIVSGAGVFLSGLILTAVAFPQGAAPGSVGQGELNALATTFILTSAALSIVGIACLSFYPITRAHQAELVRRLEEQGS